LRALLYRRVHQAGLKISLPRVLSELDGIREVVGRSVKNATRIVAMVAARRAGR
jgi:hypothetical protein